LGINLDFFLEVSESRMNEQFKDLLDKYSRFILDSQKSPFFAIDLAKNICFSNRSVADVFKGC
jgi:hypothetical protein